MKKWSKWIAGMASVATFTTFLYVEQRVNNEPAATPVLIPEVPQSTVSAPKSPLPFIESTVEAKAILEASAVEHSARERLLADLDWGDNEEITLPSEYIGRPANKSEVRTRRS